MSIIQGSTADIARTRQLSGLYTEEKHAKGILGLMIARSNDAYVAAHKHSVRHRAELEASTTCGCFYCLRIFSPSEITEWIDDGQTALCPHCPVDSVIGSASGYPITPEFLKLMHDFWF